MQKFRAGLMIWHFTTLYDPESTVITEVSILLYMQCFSPLGHGCQVRDISDIVKFFYCPSFN